jgi:hypothetical protein
VRSGFSQTIWLENDFSVTDCATLICQLGTQ